MAKRESLNEKDKERYLKKIEEACYESIRRTKHWVNYHMCSLRALAKYEGLLENRKRSEKLFLKSIKLARDLERKYEMAVSLFEYGKFLKDSGDHVKSRMNIERAFAIFYEINSKVYMQRSKALLK